MSLTDEVLIEFIITKEEEVWLMALVEEANTTVESYLRWLVRREATGDNETFTP